MATGKNGLSLLLKTFSKTPWYISPDYLESFLRVFNDKLTNHTIQNLDSMTAKSQEVEDTLYQEFDNLALFQINGILVQKASYLDSLCGFVSYSEISKKLSQCSKDNIGFIWNCPGGDASGVHELAEQVFSLRQSKFTFSLNESTMASAAYYIGSACDKVYVSDVINHTGCIGTVMCHVDQSKFDAKEGYSYTYIKTGEFKTLGNPHSPLKENELALLQADVDLCTEQFINSIAKYRNLSNIEQIKTGRTFAAEDALKLGLIDGIKTLQEIINT